MTRNSLRWQKVSPSFDISIYSITPSHIMSTHPHNFYRLIISTYSIAPFSQLTITFTNLRTTQLTTIGVNNGDPLWLGNFKTAMENFDVNKDGLIDFREFKMINKMVFARKSSRCWWIVVANLKYLYMLLCSFLWWCSQLSDCKINCRKKRWAKTLGSKSKTGNSVWLMWFALGLKVS